MFEYLNGFRKTMYWSVKKMKSHAKKYSSGYRNDLNKGTDWTFWSRDFDGMAFKTMLRQLLSKWGIMSVEMQKAFESDMAVIREDNKPEYVDNDYDLRILLLLKTRNSEDDEPEPKKSEKNKLISKTDEPIIGVSNKSFPFKKEKE